MSLVGDCLAPSSRPCRETFQIIVVAAAVARVVMAAGAYDKARRKEPGTSVPASHCERISASESDMVQT